ncbi:MAG: type II toxin-antitoxin system VapC family toxin [Acidobacteriaceae bacterium]|nr:type II toxin-antitoxin system VapC family toxin [Acidobacteriaceae bacterium]MBV9781371.1 type II toxin-antitoxin system VapC family toxin [Acidobacteriaceae bacterium]
MDTSFLISLYSPDANSIAAAQIMQVSKSTHLVSTFTELERINALEMRVFRKEISSAQAKSSLRDFEKDVSRGVFQLTRLPEEAFQRAQQISLRTTARLGTRTADLLHVAAALELNVDYLYSFDRQQRKLAQRLQMKVN